MMTPSRVVARKIFRSANFGKLLATGLMLGGVAFLLQNRPAEMAALRAPRRCASR